MRTQLPPQIRKVEVTNRRTGKPVLRYQLTVDAGINPETGARQQIRRRYTTEAQARRALSEIGDQAATGRFVPRREITVGEVITGYLAGRHRLRASSREKLAYDLAPLRERHGDMPVQRLTKADIDALVSDLVAGGTKTAKGRVRSPWGAVAVNKVTQSISMLLADAHRQGLVARNVAEHVDRIASPHKGIDTYTEDEVRQLLAAIADGRLAHAWELALSGLRRGEIAGLRWADIDLEAKTLVVANNRVAAGSKTVEGDPKSETSRRTLPLPNRLVSVLKVATQAPGGGTARVGRCWWPMGIRGVQRGRTALLPRRSIALLAGSRRGGGAAPYQAARGAAYLRHPHAPARRAGRGDRRMDRTQGRQPHDAAVCSLAVCCTARRRSEFGPSCDVL